MRALQVRNARFMVCLGRNFLVNLLLLWAFFLFLLFFHLRQVSFHFLGRMLAFSIYAKPVRVFNHSWHVQVSFLCRTQQNSCLLLITPGFQASLLLNTTAKSVCLVACHVAECCRLAAKMIAARLIVYDQCHAKTILPVFGTVLREHV